MEKEQNKKELYTLAEWTGRSDRPKITGTEVRIDEKTRLGPGVRIEGEEKRWGEGVSIDDSEIGANTKILATSYHLCIDDVRMGADCSINISHDFYPRYGGWIRNSVIGNRVQLDSPMTISYAIISSGCHISFSSVYSSFIGEDTEITHSRINWETRIGKNATIEKSRTQFLNKLPDNIILKGAWIRVGMIIIEELVIESFVYDPEKHFSPYHHPSIIERYGLDKDWTLCSDNVETIVTPLCEHPISHFISFKHKPDSAWKKDISFSEKELRNYSIELFDLVPIESFSTWVPY